MCHSLKNQYEVLERIFDAYACGWVRCARDGATDDIPLLSEALTVIFEEFCAEVGRPLIHQPEIEAYCIRRLVLNPAPGMRVLSRAYLSGLR